MGRGGGLSHRDVRPGIRDLDQSALDTPFKLASASETVATEWLDGLTLRPEISSDQKDAVAVGAVVDETRPPDSFLLVQVVQPSQFLGIACVPPEFNAETPKVNLVERETGIRKCEMNQRIRLSRLLTQTIG